MSTTGPQWTYQPAADLGPRHLLNVCRGFRVSRTLFVYAALRSTAASSRCAAGCGRITASRSSARTYLFAHRKVVRPRLEPLEPFGRGCVCCRHSHCRASPPHITSGGSGGLPLYESPSPRPSRSILVNAMPFGRHTHLRAKLGPLPRTPRQPCRGNVHHPRFPERHAALDEPVKWAKFPSGHRHAS